MTCNYKKEMLIVPNHERFYDCEHCDHENHEDCRVRLERRLQNLYSFPFINENQGFDDFLVEKIKNLEELLRGDERG